mmetsp:Transcript_71897/g.166391  ORF Transcript_71897/g.166391 Transcript_71897/m.166391 type:complete len:214 (+) Transcript_71897:61-702(+)
MNTDKLLARIGLQKTDVLSVYLLGSRLWGTAAQHSDWDVLIVTRKESEVHELNGQGVDAVIMGPETFIKRLGEHRFKELCTLWLPAECRLLEEFSPARRFELQPQVLYAHIAEESLRDWSRVEKYLRDHRDKESVRRGKKTALSTLRELLLCLQLVRDGRITDYGAANNIHFELRDLYSVEWESFDIEFGNRYRGLVNELAKVCGTEQNTDPA